PVNMPAWLDFEGYRKLRALPGYQSGMLGQQLNFNVRLGFRTVGHRGKRDKQGKQGKRVGQCSSHVHSSVPSVRGRPILANWWNLPKSRLGIRASAVRNLLIT